MQMPGRVFSSASYRYGFNGKENDNETGLQDYGMRIYDKRLGKFLSVDPLRDKFPFYSPYQFAGNKPINSIDLDGAEPLEVQLALDISKWWLFGDPFGARSLKAGAEGVIADQNNLRPFHQAGRGPGDPVSQKFNSNQASLKSYEQLGKGGSEYLQFVLETWLNTLPMEQATALALKGATRLVGKVLGKEAAIILERATVVFEQSLKSASKTPSSSAANKLLREPMQHAEFLDNLALNSVQNGAAKGGLKPLGLGTTGRTVAANEFEATAMQEILSNPTLGSPIKKLSPMVDKSGKWDGWSKMYYNYVGEGGKKFQIHFNAAFDDAGKMIKVDDFKFKDH